MYLKRKRTLTCKDKTRSSYLKEGYFCCRPVLTTGRNTTKLTVQRESTNDSNKRTVEYPKQTQTLILLFAVELKFYKF